MRFTKELSRFYLPVLAWIAVGVLASSAGQAAVVFSGDVLPTASGDWNADTDGYVGCSGGTGTALIDNASGLVCKDGYIGDGVAGAVTVDGVGSTWTLTPIWDVQMEKYVNGNLYVGNEGGTATLDITSGGTVSGNNSYIGTGETVESSGTVTVDGATWNNIGHIIVGNVGHGELHIQNGGAVVNSFGYIGHNSMYGTGTGAVTVSGSSTWTNNYRLYVGRGNTATLTIDTGGTVTNSSQAYISFGSTATVDGAGSTWSTADNLYVGDNSNTGLLNITNGGHVNVDGETEVQVGMGTIHFSGGTLDVGKTLFTTGTGLTGTGTINANGLVSDTSLTFDGSATTTAAFGTAGALSVDMSGGVGELGVGYASTAALTIENGAAVSSARGWLGYKAGSVGTATVNAATWTMNGTSWTLYDGELYVGNEGTGKLEITGGGTVSNTSGNIGYIGGSAGTVTVDGAGSTWATIAAWDSEREFYYGGDLTVGYEGNARLSIRNGGFVSVDNRTLIGRNSSSTAVIDFNAGTLSTKSLYVGASQLTGTGHVYTNGLVSNMNLTFDSTHGASQTFTYPGSSVLVTLDMTDSSAQGDLGVGYRGNSSLLITDGLTVGVSGAGGRGVIGYQSGSSGTATISGSATWNCDYVQVGFSGTGRLNITGGTVNSISGALGMDIFSCGTAMVDGSGSVWNVSEQLSVGQSGEYNSLLGVYNGGVVNAGSWVYVGAHCNAAGILRVNGAGSKLSAKYLLLGGDAAQGTLEIQNGGVVELSEGCISLGDGSSASIGNIYINGGALQYSGTASQSAWITVGYGSGNVYIESGGAGFDVSTATNVGIDLALQQYTYSPGGGLTKTGAGTLTLSGDNTYTGLTCVNGGTLKLADESTTWTGAFKPIFTGGSASLGGGVLLFNYSDTYDDATALSNIQAAITAGKIFAAYHTPPLLCSGNSATDIVTVMNTLYGDANVDGSVNGTDLNAVLSCYNQSGQIWANGDFNFDGSVNGTDLNTVLSNYNQSITFASTAAVPEPSTLLLMVLGLVGLLAWRKGFGIC